MNVKRTFHGAIGFTRKNGYIISRRFTDEQIEGFSENEFFQNRTRCCASITMEIITTSTRISFDYKFFMRTGVKSTFEVYVDGFLTYLIYDTELKDKGNLSFEFKGGKKRIEIYIPHYSEVGLKNFKCDGDCKPVPKKRKKILFLGDSITQGGGSKRSGQTFVNVLKRELNCEILNQGIGGHSCDANTIKALPFVPNRIVVAYGTNHRCFDKIVNKRLIGGFFEKLHQNYGHIKTLVILPSYYGAEQTDETKNKFREIREILVSTASRYDNIQVVSAYEMIPHLAEYYLDDFVHPNALGMEVYGNNLVKAIKKIKF